MVQALCVMLHLVTSPAIGMVVGMPCCAMWCYIVPRHPILVPARPASMPGGLHLVCISIIISQSCFDCAESSSNMGKRCCFALLWWKTMRMQSLCPKMEGESSGTTKAEGGRSSPPIQQTVQHSRNAPLPRRVHRVQIALCYFGILTVHSWEFSEGYTKIQYCQQARPAHSGVGVVGGTTKVPHPYRSACQQLQVIPNQTHSLAQLSIRLHRLGTHSDHDPRIMTMPPISRLRTWMVQAGIILDCNIWEGVNDHALPRHTVIQDTGLCLPVARLAA